MDVRVLDVMTSYYRERFGNPSSSHSLGVQSQEALESSRKEIASFVGAKPSEIVFTSGATESINMALKGVAYRNKTQGDQIVHSSIEHMAVINTCRYLARQGFKVDSIPVDHYGIVNLNTLQDIVSNRTLVVSIMYANEEIGTIEPICEATETVHRAGAYLHVDAAAAVAQIPIDVGRKEIDLMSFSSNDLYGPKGVGTLYIREGTRIEPFTHGGGQERGLRSGTENIPGIVGMAKAAEIARAEMADESLRLKGFRDKLIEGILSSVKEAYLNGHPTERLPNNVNIRFSYVEGESLILSLDMERIQVSSGSACTSKTLEPSHVLRAIGLKPEEAHGSIVFTFGRESTHGDVEYVLDVLPPIVKRLRIISPLTPKDFAV